MTELNNYFNPHGIYINQVGTYDYINNTNFNTTTTPYTTPSNIPGCINLVISDRSVVSGIAYANQFEIDKLIELNLIATSNILPTHIILLELTPEELKFRLSQKANDSIELRGIDYLINIQNRMKETIQKLNINHIFIDASLEIEEIEKRIEDFINAK